MRLSGKANKTSIIVDKVRYRFCTRDLSRNENNLVIKKETSVNLPWLAWETVFEKDNLRRISKWIALKSSKKDFSRFSLSRTKDIKFIAVFDVPKLDEPRVGDPLCIETYSL